MCICTPHMHTCRYPFIHPYAHMQVPLLVGPLAAGRLLQVLLLPDALRDGGDDALDAARTRGPLTRRPEEVTMSPTSAFTPPRRLHRLGVHTASAFTPPRAFTPPWRSHRLGVCTASAFTPPRAFTHESAASPISDESPPHGTTSTGAPPSPGGVFSSGPPRAARSGRARMSSHEICGARSREMLGRRDGDAACRTRSRSGVDLEEMHRDDDLMTTCR